VFVNGDWMGCVEDYSVFCEKYRLMRRTGKIHFMATIAMDVRSNEIYMWVDIGRIVRPLVIVYNNQKEFVESNYTIQFKQWIRLTKDHVNGLITNAITMRDLLDQGIVEYISPEEQQNCLVSKDIETFNMHTQDEFLQFTHLDIPQSIIGIPGLTSPYTNHNQPARGIFQTNQVKQTCGLPCLNYYQKSYKEMFVQMHNQKPITKTLANKFIAPTGMNAIVAIMIYGGYNQDDSLIMNQGAIDRGLYSNHHFTFEKTELDKNEKFLNPDPAVTTDIKPFSNYSKLVNGKVPIGTYIENGDIIIGKVANLNKSDQYENYKFYDKSIVYKYKEPAYVWDVIEGRNEDDTVFCKIVFRSVRNVEIGNKFSSRSGQKGTVGMIYRDSDMPFTEDGVKPDIIFNPHSLPSRMTMGVILEGMQSKVNAMKGTITDATIFRKVNIDDISGELVQLGFESNGAQRLYNGMTGKWIDAHIFIGPIYYQCLQKFTVDTVYAHKTCPTDATTRQPLDGKSSSGGLRNGEMEQWTMSISATKLLAEKSRDHSDGFDMYVCRICNRRAIVNEKKKIFRCKRCGDKADICRIKSTWTCKLFFDELEAANIGTLLMPKQITYQANKV
jgi:DNA-directed RNA polymerase II subunit RPB2